MKRALSLILTLVLCLGLCACEDNSKYVGTYEFTDHYSSWYIEQLYYKEILTLDADGTGTYKRTTTKDGKYIKEGKVVETGNIQWETSDEYIIVKYSGQRIIPERPYSFFEITDPEDVERSRTFEFKGNLLIDIVNEDDIFRKTE